MHNFLQRQQINTVSRYANSDYAEFAILTFSWKGK
jgi:hypothetical protein